MMKLSTKIILMCVALMFSAGGALALPQCPANRHPSTSPQLLDFVTEQIWLGRMMGHQAFGTNPFDKEKKA
jgi:hypothetical protein